MGWLRRVHKLNPWHKHRWYHYEGSLLFVKCRCGDEAIHIYDAPGPG